MLKGKLSGLAYCVLLGSSLAHAGQFLQSPQYPTGTNPQAVAMGDFNGDGNLDLAVANADSNTISVLLGNGDGTFRPKVDYVTGDTPLGIAVADFNIDGHADIAVTNSASNTVSIFLGNGDGTFRTKTDYPTGRKPQGIAVADFNGDGRPDLAVTSVSDGTVAVLLGNGDGTFKAGVPYNTGSNPVAVAAGDFNQDGIPDLAVANSGSSTVSVLLGAGDGTFHSQSQFVTGANPVAIVLADFNGDDFQDIAVADQNGVGACILLGKGNGAFQTRTEYATALSPSGIAVGDFNGDGKLDLAISAAAGNTASVLWGNGDGTFKGYLNAGAGDIPSALVAGDFDNDGRIDIAIANSGSNSISMLLSNGNKTFQARTDYPAGVTPNSVATADFNGDGILDVAVANNNCPTFPNCGEGTVSVLLGNGDGSFKGSIQSLTGPETDPISLVVGDFNGDDIPDLAVGSSNTNTLNYVTVLLGKGDGTFQTAQDFLVGSGPASVALGDLNSDGRLDLVTANFTGNNVSVLLGNGDGTFANAISYTAGNGPIAVAVGDFNGDHKLDLAVVNETDNTVSILLSNGDGTFKGQLVFSTGTGGNPLAVVTGDFNDDHILDLAVANKQTQQVSVLLGNGDGTFQAFRTFAAGTNPVSITTADFNGDGKVDLALTSIPSGSNPGNLVSLLLGNGDGTFAAPSLYGTGSQAFSAAVGDVNGDGAPDLVVANGGSNTVSTLLNTRNTKMSVVSSSNLSAYGESVTFTTTVAPTIANRSAPSGTVTLKNGSTTVGSGSLASGQVSISTTTLPVGADSLSAVYSGDSNYQSNTIAFSQTVQEAGTTTALTSSVNPAYPSEMVTFTATVSSSTSGTPTGTVKFLDGTNPIGSAAANGSGVATFSTSTLGVGTHDITVSYAGDGNFTASTSLGLNQVVQQGNTSAALISSANPSTIGQAVDLTATVTSAAGIVPTGTVKFMDGTVLLGSSSLNASGVAEFSSSTLVVGTHGLTAAYGGDTNSDASTSPVLNEVVQKANTSTTLAAAPTAANLNQIVTLTATVSSQVSSVPTGSVTFMDGVTQVGVSTTNGSGVATLTTSILSAGTHNIMAAYGGDANFNASTSSVVALPVTPPAFNLSASPLSPATITPGASAKSTVTIATSGGLNPSVVALTCEVSPAVSPAATCSLGAISVSNNTGASLLTVTMPAAQAAVSAPFEKLRRSAPLALVLMFPAILLTGQSLWKRNQKIRPKLSLVGVVFVGCLLQLACGVSGSSAGRASNAGAPSGSYTVTVTGSVTGMPSQTTSVSVTAQ